MKDLIKYWMSICADNLLVAYLTFIAFVVFCAAISGITALICNAVAK